MEFSLDDRQPTRVLQKNGWRGHETQILDLDASGRYPLVKRTSTGFAWLGWIADGQRHRLPGKLPRASVTLESATW